MIPPTPRPHLRYGSVGDYGAWKAVIEEYYWDRLEPAFKMAVALGVGSSAAYESWYRLIEAERDTRCAAEQTSVNDWLTIERIPHETEQATNLPEAAVQTCEAVAERLGMQERPPTMLTVLGHEADAPWAVGRYGYMVDKHPYDKICIPNRSLESVHELREVIAHEYAHIVVLNVTQGRAPSWLNEAIAMLVQGPWNPGMAHPFLRGQSEWLDPDQLEHAHTAQRQGDPNPARTWRAYQQSACIGRYLSLIDGDEGISRLLYGFADNSAWTELKMGVVGQTPADEALRQTYGLGEEQVFQHTLEWLQRT